VRAKSLTMVVAAAFFPMMKKNVTENIIEKRLVP
jgi:hypothetical protein